MAEKSLTAREAACEVLAVSMLMEQMGLRGLSKN